MVLQVDNSSHVQYNSSPGPRVFALLDLWFLQIFRPIFKRVLPRRALVQQFQQRTCVRVSRIEFFQLFPARECYLFNEFLVNVVSSVRFAVAA